MQLFHLTYTINTANKPLLLVGRDRENSLCGRFASIFICHSRAAEPHPDRGLVEHAAIADDRIHHTQL
jgi:hypothetical protein